MTIYAIDFGRKLAIHGPSGKIPAKALRLPRVKGGRTPAQHFAMTLEALMVGSADLPAGDVVFEGSTINSSGCESDDVVEILSRHPSRRLLVLKPRAVLNLAKDLGMAPEEKTDDRDAALIYRIVTEQPERARRWIGPIEDRLVRVHRSVRPHDQRRYRGTVPDKFMSLLPPYSSLPEELRAAFGDGSDYTRSITMPFAMAMTEPYLRTGPGRRRDRFERIIGLYEHGYPSFYRRAAVDLMQDTAKRDTGKARFSEVTPDERKLALKKTRRMLRRLLSLTSTPTAAGQ